MKAYSAGHNYILHRLLRIALGGCVISSLAWKRKVEEEIRRKRREG